MNMSTKEEQAVMDGLTTAWNEFLKLRELHPDDLPDFRKAIHEAQRILQARAYAKIVDPDILIRELPSSGGYTFPNKEAADAFIEYCKDKKVGYKL